MILGLPWTSWLLLILGVGLGLGISLRFYLAHRHEPGTDATSEGGRSAEGDQPAAAVDPGPGAG